MFTIIVFIARYLAAQVPPTDKCVFPKLLKLWSTHGCELALMLNFDLAAPRATSLTLIFLIPYLMHFLWVQAPRLLRLLILCCVMLVKIQQVNIDLHSGHHIISLTPHHLSLTTRFMRVTDILTMQIIPVHCSYCSIVKYTPPSNPQISSQQIIDGLKLTVHNWFKFQDGLANFKL